MVEYSFQVKLHPETLVGKLNNLLNELAFYCNSNDDVIDYFCFYKNFMSVRLHNALYNANIKRFKDLAILNASEIFKIRNLGVKCVKELIKIINAFINNSLTLDKNTDQNIIRNVSAEQELVTINKSYVHSKLIHAEQSVLSELETGNKFEKPSEEIMEKIQCETIELIEAFNNGCSIILPEKLFKIYNFIQTSNSKCTLQIIGDHFGVSRERIRQNLLKIVKTIRCNFYKMATVQFYNIIKILNSYDILSFFNFIAYGVYANSHEILATFFLDLFYTSPTVKQLIMLCKKTLEYKKQTIRHIDLISANVVYPSGLTEAKIKVGASESSSTIPIYEYLRKINRILNQLPEVKQVVYKPNIIYYKSHSREHSPDFVVELKDGNIVLFIVLPTLNLALEYNINRFNSLHLFCKNNNLGYVIIDDRYRSIYYFKNKDIDQKIETSLDYVLSKHSAITWRDINWLKKDNQITNDIIVSYVLKNKLKFKLAPFVIKR